MIQNAQIVPRDLYDIAFARWNDPTALQTALSTLREEHLQNIDTELGHLARGWMERHHQPLLAPISRRDAECAVGFVRRVLQEHIRSRMPDSDRGLSWGR